jgi:hypothetical protein
MRLFSSPADKAPGRGVHGPARAFARLGMAAAVALGGVAVVANPVAIANGCEAAGAATGYGGGTGASGDPYLITNTAEILRLAATSSDWGKHFEQTQPVNLTGCAWTPIGNSTTKFTGSFDGQDETITGLTITSSASDGVGLFGWTQEAELSNVRLVDANVTATSKKVGTLVGVLIGGTVSASSVAGTSAVSGGEFSGGLIGRVRSVAMGPPVVGTAVVTSTSSTANVIGHDAVGGLVGANDYGTIIDSHATGNVQSTATTGNAWTGGLVGIIAEGDIFNSSASGSVTAQLRYVGGLVGGARFGGVISGSHATGDVTSSAGSIGGLIGFNDSGQSVDDSFATGAVNMIGSGDSVGGLIGENYGGPITNSYATGNVTGDDYVGGLVGYHGTSDGITASYATGDVTGRIFVGGLAGYNDTALIQSSYATGDVFENTTPMNNNNRQFGGLFGYSDGDVFDSYATGNVYAPNRYMVGGLIGTVGFNFSDNRPARIERSFATGNVIGGVSAVGGLIGQNGRAELIRTNATGAVTGSATGNGDTEFVGGLIGINIGGLIVESSASGPVAASGAKVGGLIGWSRIETRSGVIERSFATGTVTGGGNEVGGLVGYLEDGSIIDSYARGAVTGADLVGGVVGDAGVGAVTNSYAVGAVTAATGSPQLVGGLVGTSTAATVVESFWDVTTSGRASSAGGAGESTESMTTVSLFIDADWSIVEGWAASDPPSAVWGVPCAQRGYPYLLWQFASNPGVPVSCSPPVVLVPGPQTDSGTQPDPSQPNPDPLTQPSVPEPVTVGGGLPQLAPGEVVVLEDGLQVAVDVLVENDVELVIRATTFELRLSGECSVAACVIDTDDEGRQVMTLEKDGLANTSGLGFLPGSRVDVWLFSEPRYLGQFTVAADGTFAGPVPFSGVEVGEHTLQVNGLSMTGVQRSANLGVVVTSAEVLTLPSAGAGTIELWMLAVALLGVGAILATRRRPVPRV